MQFAKSLTFAGAIFHGIGRDNLGLISAGIAFYGMMAVFPGITAFVTLWGFFANPDLVAQQVATLDTVVPKDAFDIIDGQVKAIANGPKTALGWASLLSIATAIWATRAGVAAMIRGLNSAYGTPIRGGLSRLFAALGVTLILILVGLVALAIVVIMPIVLAFLPLGPFTAIAVEVVRWLVAGGVVLLGIGLLYRLGPNRDGAATRLISPGSIAAMVFWALMSLGFSAYLKNFANYNEVYGSLGAVIATLMWFYLSAFVVLLGGLLNAELERGHAEGTVGVDDDPADAAATEGKRTPDAGLPDPGGEGS